MDKVMENIPVLEGRGICKRFEKVIANNEVNFSLYPGEVHALLGENGAGKSTLMKIFYGLYQPDKGEILAHGKRVWMNHPSDAIHNGIGMVHQELMLIPYMTVAENITLGQEIIHYKWFLDKSRANKEVSQLSQKFSLDLDPTIPVGKLQIGLQQRVEIVKLLYRHADILILDEPTALLTPQETEGLFQVIRQLTTQGKSIVFITHKLKEVFEIADRITVMRKGRVITTTIPAKLDEQKLAELMVGREVISAIRSQTRDFGKSVLEVHDLVVRGKHNRLLLDHITFDIKSGEILGVAGIEGNGQNELIEVIEGLRPLDGGNIFFEGYPLKKLDVSKVRKMGVGMIPDDRQRLGLILPFKISENLILNRYTQSPFAKGLRQQWNKVVEFAQHIGKVFDIRTPSVQASVTTLSGGNQQKVVLGRELSIPLRLLVASQPTRGIDIGSIEFIYKKLIAAAESGTAILLVSSDLDELMTRSDRIIVLFRGRLVGDIKTSKATKDILGQMMLGVVDQGKMRQSSFA
jgi:general nucleoside transport system ATP-binding protein